MEKEWTYCLSNGVKVIDMLVQKIDMQLEILYMMVCVHLCDGVCVYVLDGV